MRSKTQNVKVLHVINGEHYSGGERVQDVLGQALPSFGYDVSFACLKPDLFPRVYRSTNCPIHELPMAHKLDFGPLRELRRLVREDNFKIIHSHMPRTLPVSRLLSALERVPLVHHIHSPTLTEGPNKILNLASGTLERMCLSGATEVIACSAAMGRYAESIGIPKLRTTVVLNGIPAITPPAEIQPANDEWILGMVALFRERKGLEYLLHAVKVLSEQGLRLRLRAIGGFKSSDYQDRMLDLAMELRIAHLIDWVGFTNDVPAELRRVHIFVLPSTGGEGLPIATLEAMSLKLPIVTTNIPGNDEVVRPGVEGYLCDPDDVPTLAEALSRIMTSKDLWLRMRQAAYDRQRSSFSDSSMTAGVAAVYDRILQKSPVQSVFAPN